MSKPEFYRPLEVENRGLFRACHHVEADARERAGLAGLLGLDGIETLAADLSFSPAEGDAIAMKGHLTATLVQKCVITLKPVKARISADFERTYGPGAEGDDLPEDGEITVSDDDREPPDLIVEGVIDIGQAVAEQLALEIDPFPRAAGAVFEGFFGDSGESGAAGKAGGPFAALAGLKADHKESPR